MVCSKADYAFVLKLADELMARVRIWGRISTSPLHPSVHRLLTLPFLMMVSKTQNGSMYEAGNQLANSMMKAHEALCSLNINEPIYLFGIIQHNTSIAQFGSDADRSTDSDNNTYWNTIRIVRISESPQDLEGILWLFRFIEYVKAYALGPYRDLVESALRSG